MATMPLSKMATMPLSKMVTTPPTEMAHTSPSKMATTPPPESEEDDVFDSEGASAWELCKENVLPLRSGRRLQSLNDAVVRQDSATHDSQLREERHQFETELRGIAGHQSHTDLLGVWHRYVHWTEQTYPSGKEVHEVLQRSLQSFGQDAGLDQVANEVRYVDLWLKMADLRDDPLEIFAFMYSKKIGARVAPFYEQWARHLEDAGNSKKAQAVLTKGIAYQADPVEHLAKLKSDLEMRVAHGLRKGVADMILDDASSQGGHESSEAERKTLVELRGKGRHMAAPVVRVGAHAQVLGRSRGVGSSANGASRSSRSSKPPTPSSNSLSSSTSSPFKIFADDNTYQDAISEQNYSANPISASKTKENTQKPVTWNKARVKQKSTVLPSTPLTPAFDIHVDDGPEVDRGRTPAKAIDFSQAMPLSTKKLPKVPCKPLDFLEDQLGADSNEKEKMMFCKERIYKGLEEFSFEEIRAEIWRQRRK